MVLLIEGAAQLWPFKRMAKDYAKDSRGESDEEMGSCTTHEDGQASSCSQYSEKPYSECAGDLERAFEIADCMECGSAREDVTEFMHPLRRSSRLFRFYIERSQDCSEYRLYTDGGEFLMFARASLEARIVHFFTYDPNEKSLLYDPAKPAFTMSFNEAKTEWRLMQERCEHCHLRPEHLTCQCQGKQQVAFIRHTRKQIGDGIFNCMEAQIPGFHPDGRRKIFCPMLARKDLAAAALDEYNPDVQTIETMEPVWNEDIRSLVLDFKGREIVSSAKNFQVACRHKPDRLICQYAKIAPMTFGLDFRYPLSVAQAFGIAMTTICWQ
jgi:hypothetical protein